MKNFGVAVLACVTALVSVLIAAATYQNRNRPNDVVIVTGWSQQDFDSDLIVWSASFARRAPELKAAYQSLARDLEAVKAFCTANGLRDGEAVFSSVTLSKEFEELTDKQGRSSQVFKGYVLTQRVKVESTDVDRIEKFSRGVGGLIDAGVELYSEPPEYYYTKLGALKLEMISAATRDARARAERIVQNAGGRLGALRFSSLGVFQITVPNSNTDSTAGGNFDVSSRRKTASITIRLQFGVK